MLGDGEHDQLLDILAVAQVANESESTEDDADEIDAGV